MISLYRGSFHGWSEEKTQSEDDSSNGEVYFGRNVQALFRTFVTLNVLQRPKRVSSILSSRQKRNERYDLPGFDLAVPVSRSSDSSTVEEREPTVSFAEELVIEHETYSLSSFTPEEKDAYWYSNDELTEISENALKVAQKVNDLCQRNPSSNKRMIHNTIANRRSSCRSDDTITVLDRDTLRGLETFLDTWRVLHDTTRDKAYNAVFTEQEKESLEVYGGLSTEYKISRAYQSISRQAKRQARKVALHDASAALTAQFCCC